MSETSKPDAVRLDSLREQVESLRLQRQIQALESIVRASDLASRHVMEGWGDSVDRREYLRDGQGISSFGDFTAYGWTSRPDDRRNGDNAPFWTTEHEHAAIRGVARLFATLDEVAIGSLESLCNYVVGPGAIYKAKPKAEFTEIVLEQERQLPQAAMQPPPQPKAKTVVHPEAQRAVDFVQRIIDTFFEDNGWEDGLERELFLRSRRDGEYFVALYPRGGVHVDARVTDPAFVTEPDSPRRLEDYLGIGTGLDWKYGIPSPPNDSTKHLGYFVSNYGDRNDWEFITPQRMIHMRLNVDREVKRGLSDYYPVYENLERVGRVTGNTLEGVAIQAAIAYIREHAQDVSIGDIEERIAAVATDRISVPRSGGGTRQANMKRTRPGTVVDITKGMTYHAGPLGDSRRGEAYIAAAQAGMRRVGTRWNMPEYMISGDASNANYSSTMVAESPFVKASEARQWTFFSKKRELLWKVVALVLSKVRGYPWDVRRLKEMVDISIDPPEIAVRDREAEHRIRKDEHAAGILSKATWAAEAGRDLEHEQALGAQEELPTLPMPTFEQWRGYP